jgi:carbon-monoxide dehydrogenase large subunit
MAGSVGLALKRKEDPRFLTGRGTYADNMKLTGVGYLAILRSPHAHARIRSVNTSAAAASAGVIAVYTGSDFEGRVVPTAWNIPDSELKTPAHPPVAQGVVRYVGDAVAVVVAESRYAAEDALERIDIEYQPLPSVTNGKAATEAGAPQLHDDVPNNIAFHWRAAGGDIEAAFRDAPVVSKLSLVNQRLMATAMEGRVVVAQYEPNGGNLTVWATTQNPHIHRFLFSALLGVPEHKVRVVGTDIGGGFGVKIPFYPEDLIVADVAMKLGRPVKWTETRRESYLASTHGRDHITEVELAANSDGTLRGLRGTTYANLGAYHSTAGPGVPTILHGLVLPGAYNLPAINYDVYGVFTNTTPVDAYRGAGRPEATYIVERLMDKLAADLKMDPVELRRRNFIAKESFPAPVVTGITYDSGDYHAAMDKALEILDYKGFRDEQAGAREQGRYLGVGFSSYIECCGLAPSRIAGAVGFGGGLWESADIRVSPLGKVLVAIGTHPHGQGEETTFAQIVSEELGVPVEDVEILHGDTASTPMGWGTYGSRTLAVGGTAVVNAARKVREKARKVAAHLLEAADEDVEWTDGQFQVKGRPDRAKTFADVALMANVAWNMPEGMEPGLQESAFFDPDNFVFPFGTHVAVVEIDRETGDVRLKRYIAVDDCGRVINPLIVDGQVHGGVVQGVGQALWEHAEYDASGQLVTGSMMDYAVPRSDYVPAIETARTETPSPVNPLGAKGIGEAGTIASTPAVVNAVIDALSPLGITHLDMPLTPERVWRAIQGARS